MLNIFVRVVSLPVSNFKKFIFDIDSGCINKAVAEKKWRIANFIVHYRKEYIR